MYRSQSTSSVYFDQNIPNGHVTWKNGFNETGNEGSNSVSSTMDRSRVRRQEESHHGDNISTLTSALTGSKMATNTQVPTVTRKPLPKALLPKSQRVPASPPVMGGTVYGRSTPTPSNDVRRSSVTSLGSPALSKSISPATGYRVGSGLSTVSRPHSASVSGWSTSSIIAGSIFDASPRYELNSRADANSPVLGLSEKTEKLSLLESLPDQSESNDSVFDAPQVRGRDATAYRTHQAPPRAPLVVRQVRRREPVVQDSIYPILRAALGKDTDVSDNKTQEEIDRQVFGRAYRFGSVSNHHTASSGPPLTPLTSPPSLYSSMDDVFAQSRVMSSGVATLPRNHMKSNSDVVTMRDFERLPSKPRRPNTAFTTGGSITEIAKQSARTPTAGEFVEAPVMAHTPSTRTESFQNSTNLPPYSPPPPLPSNPPPIESINVGQSTRSAGLKMVDQNNSWYDPISTAPRRIIRNPSVSSPTPNNAQRSLVFGDAFPSDVYPLLAKVESNILDGDAESVDSPRGRASRVNEKVSALPDREDVRVYDDSTRESLANDVGAAIEHAPNCVSDFTLAPPVGFRDESSSGPRRSHASSSIVTTTAHSTAVPLSSLPISHHATDSVNTEDSGLDRWERDHSADELDTPGSHPASASKFKRRSGNWPEDLSEGRGSLSSSPRPQSTDDQCLSPTADYYSTSQNDITVARSFIHTTADAVPPHSFLGQLLAENATHHRHQVPDRPDPGHSSVKVSTDEQQTKLVFDESSSLGLHFRPPSEFDSQSNVSGGGIDTESSHSFSTIVHSTVTVSGGTVDQSRLDNDDAPRLPPPLTAEETDQLSDRGFYVEQDVRLRGTPTQLSDSGAKVSEAWNHTSRFSKSDDIIESLHPDVREEAHNEREMVLEIIKSQVGVGFCIEGGKGSLSGDRPIVVKRLFRGGVPDGPVNLRPGDELVSIGGQPLSGFSHYDAWKYIKSLPNGPVQLIVRRMP